MRKNKGLNNFIPYITISTTKGEMKFLIDTGANKNYISPEHVNVENAKLEKGLKVTNINGTFEIDRSVSFDPFSLNKKLKFYVFKFHQFFDGLIGYESLRDLNAQLDIGKNKLKIGRKTIELKKRFPETQKINLNEQEIQFIKIKTLNEGDFIIGEERNMGDFSILPGIYNSKNNFACVAVKNHSKLNLEINVNEISFKNDEFIETQGPKYLTKNKIKIQDDSLDKLEKEALEKIISDNSEILYFEEEKLSFTHRIKHKIRTVDNIPIHTKSYRYPQIFENEVQKQIQKMLKDGIIKESISPYTSPVWVVPKKADASGLKKFRLVIDYRKLNEKTISDRYPIPDITEILDKLGRATYFSTIDLVSGFHQIQLDKNDFEKTAFSVSSGKYEFTRMPFGLKNAPATFQRVMDAVLREFVGVCCLVYMDDIIIFSSSFEEHVKDITKILQKLKEACLKIQLDKCYFFRREVQFLGHTVTEKGVKPNCDKIEVIKNWPIPRNEKELKQFLGTIGYYRRFIKDFAKMVKPLTQLLRSDTDFTFTPEIIQCFEKCKSLLTLDPILAYPDFAKEFILTTDASDFAIGAVLSQGQIGKDRPIAYASRTLCKTEENYCTTEKELLAIIWAVKHFRPYLYGRRFKLITDHQPLIYSMTSANPKILRWKIDLSEFDFETIYKPGRENVVADALSRIKPTEVNVNSQNEAENDHDEDNNDSDGDTVHSADTSDDHYIWTTEKPVNMFKTQLIFKISSLDIDSYEQVFPKYHRFNFSRPDYSEEALVKIFKEKLNPKGVNCIYCPIPLTQVIQETYRKHFSHSKIFKLFISQVFLQDVRRSEEQDEIVQKVHEYAHRGMKENKLQILSDYFFPEIDKKLKIYINNCLICKKCKYDRKPPKLIQKTNDANRPFQKIHIDIFFIKGRKMLTVVDAFSKFANVIPLETRTIIDLKRAITEHLRIFGRPEIIVCDQEPGFTSIDFIGFLQDLNIELHHASCSNSNGIVERFHSTLIELFRTMNHKHTDLDFNDRINILVDLYNNTVHSATGFKPRQVIFNYQNRTDADDIFQNYQKTQSAILVMMEKRKKQVEEENKSKSLPKQLDQGKDIFVKVTQRITKDKEPFKISRVQENNELTFRDAFGVKVHKNRIKK